MRQRGASAPPSQWSQAHLQPGLLRGPPPHPLAHPLVQPGQVYPPQPSSYYPPSSYPQSLPPAPSTPRSKEAGSALPSTPNHAPNPDGTDGEQRQSLPHGMFSSSDAPKTPAPNAHARHSLPPRPLKAPETVAEAAQGGGRGTIRPVASSGPDAQAEYHRSPVPSISPAYARRLAKRSVTPPLPSTPPIPSSPQPNPGAHSTPPTSPPVSYTPPNTIIPPTRSSSLRKRSATLHAGSESGTRYPFNTRAVGDAFDNIPTLPFAGPGSHSHSTAQYREECLSPEHKGAIEVYDRRRLFSSASTWSLKLKKKESFKRVKQAIVAIGFARRSTISSPPSERAARAVKRGGGVADSGNRVANGHSNANEHASGHTNATPNGRVTNGHYKRTKHPVRGAISAPVSVPVQAAQPSPFNTPRTSSSEPPRRSASAASAVSSASTASQRASTSVERGTPPVPSLPQKYAEKNHYVRRKPVPVYEEGEEASDRRSGGGSPPAAKGASEGCVNERGEGNEEGSGEGVGIKEGSGDDESWSSALSDPAARRRLSLGPAPTATAQLEASPRALTTSLPPPPRPRPQ